MDALAALVALYARHGDALLRLAARLVGEADAPDAVQDTFVAAIRKGVGDRPGPWLFAVCRNRCLDLVRARRRRLRTFHPAGVLPDGTSQLDQHPGREADPHDIAVAAELLARAGAVIAANPGASLVRAAVFGPETIRAVARRAGVNEQTLKTWLRRTRQQIPI